MLQLYLTSSTGTTSGFDADETSLKPTAADGARRDERIVENMYPRGDDLDDDYELL